MSCSIFISESRKRESDTALRQAGVRFVSCSEAVTPKDSRLKDTSMATTSPCAATATPVKVTVTQVYWFDGNLSIGNGSGFTVGGGHMVSLGLVCEIFCPKFVGATVSSPFTLVSATFAYPWNEYVNVTAKAPTTAYTGPLTIVLAWAPISV